MNDAASSHTPPTPTVELVTPEIAAHWLASNIKNRNLRKGMVMSYAADMAAGNWHFNGDPIRFSADGKLIDGQHRLHAIVESGVSVHLVILRGLRGDQQHTIDTGAKRKFADVLKLHGEPNYVNLSTITRGVDMWITHGVVARGATTASNSRLLQVLDRYPWIRDANTLLARVNTSVSLPISASAGPWFAFTNLDPVDTEHFFQRLISDQNHVAGDPIYTLRRALLKRAEERGVKDIPLLAAITIIAWNKYRSGEECQLLTWRRGGANPQPFPEPK